jgi:hypothetical protein
VRRLDVGAAATAAATGGRRARRARGARGDRRHRGRRRDRALALADVCAGVSRLALVAALFPRLRALEPLPSTLAPAERRAFLRMEWREAGAEETADLEPDGALLVRTAGGTLDRRVTAA